MHGPNQHVLTLLANLQREQRCPRAVAKMLATAVIVTVDVDDGNNGGY